jgi:hypothetical protein
MVAFGERHGDPVTPELERREPDTCHKCFSCDIPHRQIPLLCLQFAAYESVSNPFPCALARKLRHDSDPYSGAEIQNGR